MRRVRLAAALSTLLLLSACSGGGGLSTGSGSLRDYVHTATGAITEAGKQAAATIELGKLGVDKAKSAYGATMSRKAELQEGIEKITEGKEQVEKALAR